MSQARSSGRKPEFFWLLRQFLRSISLVRDVPVAAEDDLAPLAAQLREMRQERLEEAELRRLAMRPARARRQVDADHRELAEVRLEIAPLGVELAACRSPSTTRGGRLA